MKSGLVSSICFKSQSLLSEDESLEVGWWRLAGDEAPVMTRLSTTKTNTVPVIGGPFNIQPTKLYGQRENGLSDLLMAPASSLASAGLGLSTIIRYETSDVACKSWVLLIFFNSSLNLMLSFMASVTRRLQSLV